MAVRVYTGCTVCRGAMDGKERRIPEMDSATQRARDGGACMYRMNGISQGAKDGGETRCLLTPKGLSK